jgi:hypothetical protein
VCQYQESLRALVRTLLASALRCHTTSLRRPTGSAFRGQCYKQSFSLIIPAQQGLLLYIRITHWIFFCCCCQLDEAARDGLRRPDVAFCFMSGATLEQFVLVGCPDTPSSTYVTVHSTVFLTHYWE